MYTYTQIINYFFLLFFIFIFPFIIYFMILILTSYISITIYHSITYHTHHSDYFPKISTLLFSLSSDFSSYRYFPFDFSSQSLPLHSFHPLFPHIIFLYTFISITNKDKSINIRSEWISFYYILNYKIVDFN